MANEIYVNFVIAVVRYQLGHQAMRFFIRAFFGDQSQSPSYAEDMCVDRKDRAIACKQQRTGHGLRTYAFEALKKLFRFFERRLAEERKIERAAPRMLDILQ